MMAGMALLDRAISEPPRGRTIGRGSSGGHHPNRVADRGPATPGAERIKRTRLEHRDQVPVGIPEPRRPADRKRGDATFGLGRLVLLEGDPTALEIRDLGLDAGD